MADFPIHPQRLLDRLSHEFERLHTAKEDAFWTARMGLLANADAAQATLNERERELAGFMQDPARLRVVVEEVAAIERGETQATPEQRLALDGWRRTFEAQVIEHAEARDLHGELVEDEGRLSRFRCAMPLGYVDPTKGPVWASSVELSVMLTTDPDEGRRRAAWEGLRSIEPFILSHGFLDLVRKRNRLGRLLGGVDFYDATVRRTEGLTKADVFAWLDELEVKTRARTRASLRELAALKGDDALRPWNLRFAVSGDVTTEKDPHFPFGASLARWGRSFGALGIGYRGAQLVLDLVDRKGKYENGFMHGPVPAWRERSTWRPARIQFTANAIPGMVGSGQRATETLFHEGGHAAHYANVDMPAPCFAQEFAPSSVAMAETQSMFLDSLLSDADWQTRYARTVDGQTMPFALIEKAIRQGQPHAAFAVRSMLAVCYAEKAIYEIPDDVLTAERVLQEVRDIERRLLFLDEGSPRPVLSVPHLLSSDSSAYYHGYVLAEMAVAQTRAFFERRDGHLTDNRRIGADLRDSYWREGNLRRFGEFVERLTRRPLSADGLAQCVNREPDEAVDDARARIDTLADVPPFTGTVALGATIRVVDGHDVVASLADGDSFEEMADTFRTWVERRAAARLETSIRSVTN